MDRRKYRNPPIVEVVAEFRFVPSGKWGDHLVDALHRKLQPRFPLRRSMSEMNIAPAARENPSLFVEIQHGVRFFRKDERAFVQVYPYRISIHHLAPYPHWEGFRPLILDVFAAIRDLVPGLSIERLGLRYINRITIPRDPLKFPDYFTLYPHIGSSLPRTHKAFAVYLLFPFEGNRDALHLRLGSGEVSEGKQADVLLDLDYFLAHPESLTEDRIPDWMDTAHRHIVKVFEGVITDRLRAQFEEVER